MTTQGFIELPTETASTAAVISDATTLPLVIPANFEIAFLTDDLAEDAGKDSALVNGLAQHLAHVVGRHPHDLKSHLARVYLHYRSSDEDGLYSALLDLFLALHDKGLPLRIRLLMGSRSRLSATHFAALYSSLSAPVSESEIPLGRWSVLAKGLTGIPDLVIELASTRDTGRDPLIEARDFIEYCQLEDARTVLENAILANPERPELHAELLELYRATDDQQQWHVMQTKLRHLIDPLPPEWSTFHPDNYIVKLS